MKITITFELELEDQNTEEQKMEIIHKIDQAIATLEPVDMVKRTVVAYPFHRHGVVFDEATGRSKTANWLLGVNPELFMNASAFKKEYFNEPKITSIWNQDPWRNMHSKIVGLRGFFFIAIDVMEINTYIVFKRNRGNLEIIDNDQILDDKQFKEKVLKIKFYHNCELIADSESRAKFLTM